ncbi:MAG: hypothetical protein Q4F11_06160 [Eubacteriales bacterium]|nr:hypothetical protein [Eubacteriales bacterium]
MIDIYFDKLYRYERVQECCSVAIPFKKGELKDCSKVSVLQNGRAAMVQPKVTSTYDDGSIRYLFVRFLADLPANKGTVLQFDGHSEKINDEDGIVVEKTDSGYFVNCRGMEFAVKDNSEHIFQMLDDGRRIYTQDDFSGPYLKDGNGNTYECRIDSWRVIESGPVCAILAAKGSNISEASENKYDFEVRVTAYVGKPYVEVSYRIINSSSCELHVASLVFYVNAQKGEPVSDELTPMDFRAQADSTGCGDILTDNSNCEGPVFHTNGTRELEDIERKAPVENVRTFVGSSNYKTDFYIGKNGERVNKVIDDRYLEKEANEQFAEVLYGTFMADRTDSEDGLCITVFQAQQNYPKAVKSEKAGIAVMLVPENVNKIVMQPGMAREQKMLLHFHKPEEPIWEIDNRSLIYQMPDRPSISPKVFKEAGVMLDVFPDKLNDDVEMALIGKCDGHTRVYGMLNWGDSIDEGYTKQGRGNGKPVFSNNEYDFPHSCALEYARTGIRRFLDYLFVSAAHWMDSDVCHYSNDPLRIGGQWEHTAGHCKNGIMVCSHEWVEGLLDYYHFSGDERAYETAVGIGENVLRLLDTPMYAVAGEANARETGWALRTLTALYVETNDTKWTKKCEWIINSFKVWEEQYGNWLAPYTDNTAIRVGFMISVAIGSVMRYYRVFPSPEIKEMIIRAVDDIIENCLLDNGLFYYKELPSLQRLGNNTLLLEALTIAYELTGDAGYLKPGLKTFYKAIEEKVSGAVGSKQIIDDAVICAGPSTKGFAQSFIPLITYYKALSEENMI